MIPMHRFQLETSRFVFCGNRFFVLEEMLAVGLNIISIAAVAGSYLERELRERHILAHSIASRSDFMKWLAKDDFDIFISNGCPYIVPIESFTPKHLFLNIHPSPLPNLRGADPVPGSLLFGRDSGATCHVMDDGIDTGDIISQVVIPYTTDLDAPLLYQLSFLAEKAVFRMALARNFVPDRRQEQAQNSIYFTKKPADLSLDWTESVVEIVRRVRAFSNTSQGARFEFQGEQFRCLDAEVVSNPFLVAQRNEYKENQIVFNYENSIVVRKGDMFLKLKCIEGDLSLLKSGIVLGTIK